MRRLILASTSTIRRELLLLAGVDVLVVPPETDEAALTRQWAAVPPGELALSLARAKAVSVSNRSGTDLIIGADQVLEFEGKAYGKPISRDHSRAQLAMLRNRHHELKSAISLVQNGIEVWRYLGTANLVMRNFSDAFLDAYLDRMGPQALTSVGAYKVEGPGIQLFDRIDGDHFTILGLPLLPLLGFLREKGVIPS